VFEPFDTVRTLSNLIPILDENGCKYLVRNYGSIYRTSPSYCLSVPFTFEGGTIHDSARYCLQLNLLKGHREYP